MSFVKLTTSALALSAMAATTAAARDQVQIAGSSTVLPYASIVAELFGENFEFPTPVVESGGSSSGLKRFCEGVGENTIDIANASRAIREKEIKACADAGVTDIIEVRIGYDGIVFASQIAGPAYTTFEPSDIFNALGAKVLVDGAIVDNPHQQWADFNGDLPASDIVAFIPGTKHGTREVFEDKVLLEGCEATGAMAAMIEAGMSEDDAEDACIDVRQDGGSVDIDGDYTETLARIDARNGALHAIVSLRDREALMGEAREAKVLVLWAVETARLWAMGLVPAAWHPAFSGACVLGYRAAGCPARCRDSPSWCRRCTAT